MIVKQELLPELRLGVLVTAIFLNLHLFTVIAR